MDHRRIILISTTTLTDRGKIFTECKLKAKKNLINAEKDQTYSEPTKTEFLIRVLKNQTMKSSIFRSYVEGRARRTSAEKEFGHLRITPVIRKREKFSMLKCPTRISGMVSIQCTKNTVTQKSRKETKTLPIDTI